MATLEEAGGAQRTRHRPPGAGQPPQGGRLKEDTEGSRGKKKEPGWAGDQGGAGGALGEVCLAGEVCVPARFPPALGD